MDISHYYVEKGQGEPLLLLHGNGESCEYFAQQIDVFSELYHVYALDTRGHGKTPRGSAPFTIRQFAEDLLGFLDEKGVEKANLLGFSDGGNIAMIFAIRHPERVKKLILNGANLTPKGVKASVQVQIELGYRAAKLFAKKSEQARSRAEMLGLMVDSPNIPVQALKKITAETLVIAGTKDLIKRSETERIAAAIQNAQLVFVEGDHCIAAKNPKEFNKAVLAFMQQKS